MTKELKTILFIMEIDYGIHGFQKDWIKGYYMEND